MKQKTYKYFQTTIKDTGQNLYQNSLLQSNLTQGQAHQKHSLSKVREQRKMRKDEGFATSVVPGAANVSMIPSRLGGGREKLRMSKVCGQSRCKISGVMRCSEMQMRCREEKWK